MPSEPKIKPYKNYKAGGWEYSYELYDERTTIEGSPVDKGWATKGGLVIKDVSHNGYSFAKDIRVVSIWVFPRDTKKFKPKQFVLGAPDFIQQPIKEHTEPFNPNVSKQISAPENFSSYNTESALEVKWVTAKPLFIDGDNHSRHLTVTQTYIFTDYNSEPRHEPSGVLMAARLFPITTIKYDDEEDGYIDSVRIDYRLHLNLDGTLNYKVNEVFNKLIKNNPDRFKLKNFPNQAGVFKDFDSAKSIGYNAFDNKSIDSNVIFAAVEKPLLLEIDGMGLVNSLNKLDDNTSCWDNIHWWGYRGEGQPIISAPGAFHAIHLHWRWGILNQIVGSQFRSNVPLDVRNYDEKNKFIGGPLVYSSNWIQDVKFAITKNNETRTPNKFNSNLRDLSLENYSTLFNTNNSPEPKNIENADDLILWFSVESKKSTIITKTEKDNKGKETTSLKKVLASVSGKYFIQGMFFAHEPEPNPKNLKDLANDLLRGSTGAQYIPDTKPIILKKNKWKR